MVKAEQFAHNMATLFNAHGKMYIETLFNIGFMGVFDIKVTYSDGEKRLVEPIIAPFMPQTEDEIYHHILQETKLMLKGDK